MRQLDNLKGLKVIAVGADGAYDTHDQILETWTFDLSDRPTPLVFEVRPDASDARSASIEALCQHLASEL